ITSVQVAKFSVPLQSDLSVNINTVLASRLRAAVLSGSLKGRTETNEALEQIQCRGDLLYQT
uniref:hypothetical protein n=2 Tax=Enterobacteriaceae TaxID=543 RepID=UPI000AB5E1C0